MVSNGVKGNMEGKSRGGAVRVAVIIPAFNEEGRIGTVLEAACCCTLADEVIVVSDGSLDRTAEVARRYPHVTVIDLPFNVGKGGAMSAGVAATRARIVAFVDADLVGLQAEHIDKIIRPLLRNQCDMCIGVFRGGTFWSDTAQLISPYISGQRAMRRELFESIPYVRELRMGIEVSINNRAKRAKARVMRVVLDGVSNYLKEQKLGLVKGTTARYKMYREIVRAVAREKRRDAVNKRLWQ
jgi:polyisoprenyl-phosphate glycosyltransferase